MIESKYSRRFKSKVRLLGIGNNLYVRQLISLFLYVISRYFLLFQLDTCALKLFEIGCLLMNESPKWVFSHKIQNDFFIEFREHLINEQSISVHCLWTLTTALKYRVLLYFCLIGKVVSVNSKLAPTCLWVKIKYSIWKQL